MRRKSGIESTTDVSFMTNESVSSSQQSDTQSTLDGSEPMSISRQTSQASRTSGPFLTTSNSRGHARSQSAKDYTDMTPKDNQSLVPDVAADHDDPQSGSLRATRRRKTVTKTTPHTFELAEDLKPPKLPGFANTSEAQIPEVPKSSRPSSKRQSRNPDVTPTLTHSKIMTIVDVEPIKVAPLSLQPQPTPCTPERPPIASLSPSSPIVASNPARFDATSLISSPPDNDVLKGKVVVLTQGTSPIGWSIVRAVHALGARVIFGDANADAARRLIKSLGEPHLVHFQPCDCASYADMLGLFKLAVTIYGRVDHAIWGIGEDGGAAGSVGDGERGWFENAAGLGRGFENAVGLERGLEAVEHEPRNLVDTLGASVRFAHIALGYLKHTPRPKGKGTKDKGWDRSLTLLTSVASFKEMPGLPIYQMSQHAVLGLVRSMRLSVDPVKEVRVNAVVTGMMVARAFGGAGGRMSVKVPSDMPEDIGRTVAGVVVAGSAEGSRGIWYEDIVDRAAPPTSLHGRAIYVVGGECWDMEEGLSRAEQVWLGKTPSENLMKAQEGIGKGNQWMLDL